MIDTFAFADEHRTLDLNPDEVHQVTKTVMRAVRGEITMEQMLERRPKVKPDARVCSPTPGFLSTTKRRRARH